MGVQTAGLISQKELSDLIKVAAEAAGYEEGFGVEGCDLTKARWWAAYVRQSLEEQAQNNRIAEYLLTCAGWQRIRVWWYPGNISSSTTRAVSISIGSI